jgi:hypothetical protein
MNISNGISEVLVSQALTGSNKPGKVFMWPKINENPVSPIKKITRKTEGEGIYQKVSDAERDVIIKNHTHMTREGDRSSQRSSYYPPGTLFDALA